MRTRLTWDELFDAIYVVMAEVIGATLLTRDAGLARAAGHRARVELV
jgi:predicted nucleic acid-binding protein